MRNQLITVGDGGSLQSLDFKNKGVDLRTLGRASIERSTEIEWDEEHQKWYIRFLRLGRFSGKVLTTGIAWLSQLSDDIAASYPWMLATVSDDGRLLFANYSDAVETEITTIQNLRMRNIV